MKKMKRIHKADGNPENEQYRYGKKKKGKRKKLRRIVGTAIALLTALGSMPLIWQFINPPERVTIGSVYTVPYTMATQWARDSDLIQILDTLNEEEYDTAFATRVFFNFLERPLPVERSFLDIHLLEELENPSLAAIASDGDTEAVHVFLMNNGNTLESATVTLFASLHDEDGTPVTMELPTLFPDAESRVTAQQLASGEILELTAFVKHSAQLEALQFADGSRPTVYLTATVDNGSGEEEFFLGMIAIVNGEAIYWYAEGSEGSAIVPMYIKIDVPGETGSFELEYPAELAGGVNAVEAVFLPTASCQIEYDLRYMMDGKEYVTEPLTRTVRVPIYTDFSVFNYPHIAYYLSAQGVSHITLGSDAAFHDAFFYTPERLLAYFQ